MGGKKGYRVIVQGDYYAAAPGRGKIIKRYKVDVMLPSMECALSVIKNKLLNAILKNKLGDYLNFRTHEIVSYEAVGGAENPTSVPIQIMNRPELLQYIVDQGLPVKPKDFIEISDLRAAILYAVQDPKGYEEKFIDKRADAKQNRALKDLNPDLVDNTEGVEDLTKDKSNPLQKRVDEIIDKAKEGDAEKPTPDILGPVDPRPIEPGPATENSGADTENL